MFGESINLMSMGGLAVAIGLVIDDAVVVVENIHRRLTEGGGAESVERATELVAPLVGSTLTTVVVFAPLGLLSGVVGQFFRALSLTLSVAVLVSLVLALTLIPLLGRAAYRRRPPRPSTSTRRRSSNAATSRACRRGCGARRSSCWRSSCSSAAPAAGYRTSGRVSCRQPMKAASSSTT